MPVTINLDLEDLRPGTFNDPGLLAALQALAAASGSSSASNRWDSLSMEWTEDFLWQGTLSVSGGWDQIPMFGIYGLKFSGTGTKIDTNNAATERIGVLEMETGTDATGYSVLYTNINCASFHKGTWTYEAVVAPTALAPADRSNDFSMLVGFFDAPYQVDQSRGAYFLYNPRNSAIGGANPTNADRWQCVTAYGALAANKTMTLVSGNALQAVTWPDTGVQRLKVVGTATSVTFYINDILVATHTTNIPAAGSTGFMGAGLGIVKETGATIKILNVDYTRLAVTLNAARVP